MVQKIGVVGTGIFASQKHLPSIEQIDGLEIVGCYNHTMKKAEDFAKAAKNDVKVFNTLSDLLNDPEITAIDALLPVDKNLLIVKEALAANKPISIEKPIAASLEDAAEIAKLAESTSIPVMVLENWCYHHGTTKLRELLPRVGPIYMFNFQASGPFRLSQYHTTTWRQVPVHIGGFLSDAGVHDLGMITEVLGPVGSVSARTIQSKKESGDVDTLSALLNMDENEVFGTYTQSRYSAATNPVLRFQLFGRNGSLLYEKSGFDAKITVYEGPDGANSKEEVINLPDDKQNGVVAEFENWRDVLDSNDKSKLVSTPRKAYMHYATIAACVHSAQRGGALVHVRTLD